MGLKYWGEYRDVNGLVFRAEIVVDSFNGSAAEMCFAEEAIKISYPEKEIHEPIFSCGASLHVRCTEAWQYLDLFSTSERSSRVIIYRARKVIFHGYVEPNLYESEWRKPPYTITIPATDGLAALENYTPEIAKEFGMLELMQIIKSSLAETKLNLPIMVCCKLVESDPELITGTIFDGMYIESETIKSVNNGVYESESSSRILSDILKQFNCRIYQANDMWYIERIKDKCTGGVWWMYDTDGSLTSTNVNDTFTFDTDSVMFLEQPASIQIDSGYGKQTVKCDADKYESVIFNNFEAGITFMSEIDMQTQELKPKRWYRRMPSWMNPTGQPTGVKAFINRVGISQGVSMDCNISTSETVFQHSLISFIPKSTLKIEFKSSFAPVKDNLKCQYRAVFTVALFSGDYWLQMEGDGSTATYSFVHSPNIGAVAYYNFTDIDNTLDVEDFYTCNCSVDVTHKFSFNSTIQLTFVGVQVNIDGDWFYGKQYIEEVYFGDVKLAIDDKDDYNNTFTATVNSNYRREAPSIDVKFNTLPKHEYSSNYNCNISNGLYKKTTSVDYTAAEKIGEIGGQRLSVIEHILADNFIQYYDPRDIISGDVLTAQFISPEKLFRMSGRGKYYLLTGCDYKTGEAQYTVKLEEIKNETITVS